MWLNVPRRFIYSKSPTENNPNVHQQVSGTFIQQMIPTNKKDQTFYWHMQKNMAESQNHIAE